MDTVRYKLVEFMEKTRKKNESVDIIPSNWISYDIKTEELVAQFMPPPYDDENAALLHSLIECCAPAPDSWPLYAITIHGAANTYAEGLKKLKILEKKEDVFSTDEEYSSKDKAALAKEIYKTQTVLNHKLWEVLELTDENSNPSGNQLHTQEVKAAVNRGFHAQSLHLAQLSTQLEELKMTFKESSVGKMSELKNFGCPAEKYDLDLPIKNMSDFEDFDSKLLLDDNFRDDIIASIWRIASIHAPMQQTIRDIFKKFIFRDVAVQFTAVKDTGI